MVKIVAIADTDIEKRKEDADQIREYASMIEEGEMVDFAFMGMTKTENDLITFFSVKDRLRLIGAIEYTKISVATS